MEFLCIVTCSGAVATSMLQGRPEANVRAGSSAITEEGACRHCIDIAPDRARRSNVDTENEVGDEFGIELRRRMERRDARRKQLESCGTPVIQRLHAECITNCKKFLCSRVPDHEC